MPVTIRPETFSMVLFDVGELRALAEGLAAQIGLDRSLELLVDVDETTPLGRARLASVAPPVLAVESGALEDPKRPRRLSRLHTTDVIGRLLFEVKDRLDPAFGEPPPPDELTLAQAVAWQTYCVGRLGRLGHRVHRTRRLYLFRNRHGFTDAADEAFDRIWSAHGLTWADLVEISDRAQGAVAP